MNGPADTAAAAAGTAVAVAVADTAAAAPNCSIAAGKNRPAAGLGAEGVDGCFEMPFCLADGAGVMEFCMSLGRLAPR